VFLAGFQATTAPLAPYRALAYLYLMTAPDYRQRIALDPEVRFGKPVVRGTRITVGDVLGYLAGGMSEDEILREFPSLTREDIRACLAFAADREQRSASVSGT
jgi:uncharacterized protein (DUF433 family)